MPQRFTIALAQVKAGNTLESLAKKKSDKLYIFCIEQKKLLKKVYNYTMNSINL